MSTPQPPQTTILTPEQRLALEQQRRYKAIGRNVAIGGVIICPVIAFMPPRKLDLYTFALGTCFYLSADHLSHHYSNRSLIENLTPKWAPKNPLTDLPTDKARETQLKFENEKRLREGREQLTEGSRVPKEKGLLGRIWMGNEEEGWKERRIEEERKALEDGRGLGGLIMEQIWDVWTWGDKKKGEGENEEKKQ